MGQKANYNSNKKNNLKTLKILRILIIFLIAIFVIYIFVQAIRNVITETEDEGSSGVVGYVYNVDEFDTLKELLEYYGCTYISESWSNDLLVVYLKFDRDLYTNDESNERFFTNLIDAVTIFEDYASFELIDESRDIDILVTCEDDAIVEIRINDDENYYLNQDSLRALKQESNTITEFTVSSEELQSLIDNDWITTNAELGTKDSTCNNYDIYFDEGYEIKVVGRKVYNIVFTEKYEGNIISNLGVSSTADELVANLGKVTFQNSSTTYGFLGENFYIFWDFQNNQVSVYPVVTMTEDEEESFIELINEMNESSDIKQFSMDLTSLWTDYDIYDYDSDYVDLQYTLRGVELNISSSSLKNGIYIYQNYSGDLSVVDLDNVYMQEDDSVFQAEIERASDEYLKRHIEGEFTDEELEEMGTKFAVYFRGTLKTNETGYKGPSFYSRDGEYQDCELDSTLVVSSYNWYDDYNFIYSVDDDGIYLFNVITYANIKVLDIEGTIEINSAGDGEIVYNDTEVINVNIE